MIRVFPRRTNATPDDDNVRFSEPGLFDKPDDVHVSVTFTWDKSRGEQLADAWTAIGSNVKIGGPAYDDPGGDFTPGLYLKEGYTITSRGCPNNCWFCSVPKREGGILELEVKDGYNVLDNNLLACSNDHIADVFMMLTRQKEKARFTGGLEAAKMTQWFAGMLQMLKPKTAYFAYDTPDDFEPLVNACKILREVGELPNTRRAYACYVLIGYRGDTFEKAKKRLQQVIDLDLMPMAMLFNKAEGKEDRGQWIKLQREYANKVILGTKLTAARTAARSREEGLL